jgi:hypothetical protein
MSIVNVSQSNIYPKYKNLQEWINDSKNAYIGRSGVMCIDGKKIFRQGSIFGNPFKIGQDGTRDDVIKKYKQHIEKKLKESDDLKKQLIELNGKTLGCWCKPEKCHGDVLLELIDKCSK